MKIININTYFGGGGAAIAARRIHHALIDSNIKSLHFCSKKEFNDLTYYDLDSKISLLSFQIRKYFGFTLLKLQHDNNPIYHSLNLLPSFNYKIINKLKPDFVNLHWINDGFLSPYDISKLNSKVIWTLHDSWPFMGTEHHPINENNRFKTGYSLNNRLSNESGIDINFIQWKIKEFYLKNKDIHFISPSKWLVDLCKSSNLFHEKQIYLLSNPVNKNIFKPFDKEASRKLLNLDPKKKYITFGAINPTLNNLKGYSDLLEVIRKLESKYSYDDIEFLIVGSGKVLHPISKKFQIHYLGKVSDDLTMSIIYNASDLYLHLSHVENYSNMISECLSCNTHVIGYNVTGNSEFNNLKLMNIPLGDTDSVISFVDKILNNRLNMVPESINSFLDYGENFNKIITSID